MTKHEVAALLCKVLGIYALLSALNALPLLFAPALFALSNSSASATPATSVARLSWLISALPVLLDIGAALFLWLSADNLARAMVKNGESSAEPIISRDVQTLVFSALGVFTLLQAIPRAGQIATTLYLVSQQDVLLRREFKGASAPDIVALLLQLALGLWLVFGAAGLAKGLQKLRTVGVNDAD